MKILFVVGGGYKAFYLNHLKRFHSLDLLVFQSNILYEFNYYNEMLKDGLITNEILSLQKKFNTKIIAIINTNLFGIIKKECLYCDENGIKILNLNKNINLFIKNKKIIIKNRYFVPNKDICIFIINKSENKNKYIKLLKKGFVCDDKGVTLVNNGRIIRKFRKICYFSLKF